MIFHYDIPQLVPYVNWAYFYFAWQLKDGQEQLRVRREAEAFLQETGSRYRVHALLLLAEAYGDGDDIVVCHEGDQVRIPCLRQQTGKAPYLCLADFLSPLSTLHSPLSSLLFPLSSLHSPLFTKIGLFATTVDAGLESDFDADPYQKMMAQLLADRLAEAAAECLHEEVRKHLWGYAPDEHLSVSELHQERFQGIRPAVGYPSLPDASINFLIDRLLDFRQIGLRLTESGAMRPHASVSGMMLAHPEARYFSVGKIGEDQLADYAARRGIPLMMARKFLAANLQ